MSRFDFDAYDKVFPREEVPAPIDTAVEGFTPTADIKKATDDKPGDDMRAVDPEPDKQGAEPPANDTGDDTPKGD